VLGFDNIFALEDAIEPHTCSLEASEASMPATNNMPLGSVLSYRLTL
jgi:hypothetical protein